MNKRRKKILILDLDEGLLIDLERLLEDMGCDTRTTWNATEAVRMVTGDGFDCLLVGNHPPELDAEAVLREVDVQDPNCKRFVLESVVQQADCERFQALGASDVLIKRDLSQIVGRVCGHPGITAVHLAGNLQKIAG
jgi:DNA-binding NtrC family response regulator